MDGRTGRRVSRRAVLGAAAGVAAAGAGVAATWWGLRGTPSAPANEVEVGAGTIDPTVKPTPTLGGTPPPQGGTLRRMTSRSLSFDTFDAHRTGERAVLEILGRTHSRVVQWRDFPGEVPPGSIVGDLAAEWEQPDGQTLVLRLNPAARWQERPPLAGRAVTAGDVAWSLERTLELARGGDLPVIRRSWDWSTMESVDVTGEGEVRIRTNRPDPFLIETLAGAFAQIQAREAVEAFEDSWSDLDPDTVVGSGPFMFEGSVDGMLSFAKRASGHIVPNLDTVRVGEPLGRVNAGDMERFDLVLLRDRRDAELLGGRDGYGFGSVFEDSPVESSMFVGAPPWNDERLTRAIQFALDRGSLIARLFGGRAEMSAPVSPVFLPQSHLFLGDAGLLVSDRDLAIREARNLWEAGGGPGLGELRVDVPSIFDPPYAASGVIGGMLREALGTSVRVGVESYPVISRKAAEGAYGRGTLAFWLGWGAPFVEPGGARLAMETYRTGGPGSQSTGFSNAAVDSVCERLGAEFEPARRHELLAELARAVLNAGSSGVITWAVQRSGVYFRNDLRYAAASPFAGQHRDAQAFFS